MINQIKNNAIELMGKSIQALKNQISKIRTGRASTNLLDGIMVECYGTITPLRQLANIVVEDYRTLTITLFDNGLKSLVEKAILMSDLNLTPLSTGVIIRVILPPLTEERRKNLVKIIRNATEQGKVAIRNIRREANDKIKSLMKEKKISKDDEHRAQDQIQKLTDTFIKQVDEIAEQKKDELMIL